MVLADDLVAWQVPVLHASGAYAIDSKQHILASSTHLCAKRGRTMPTHVLESVDLSLLVSHDDDGLRPDGSHEDTAWLGHGRGGTNTNPRTFHHPYLERGREC